MSIEQEDPFMQEMWDAFRHAAELMSPPPSDDWVPLPHQIPPDWRWFVWLLLGGRGAGKTATTARYVHEHVHGPPCIPHIPGGHWISIVAPTIGDAVTSCVNGPSGLIAHDPKIKVVNQPGGIIARWGNGATAKLFGASTPEDVERFRSGGNRCLVWAEELAAWRYMNESWEQIKYGLRVGPWPRIVASTTPKARKLIKELVLDAMGENPRTAVTRATTNDNPHLSQIVRDELYKDYAGTRMGRQELLGEILEDVEGALWTGDLIETYRIVPQQQPDQYDRIVVSVDPAASNNENSNEHGIVVSGMARFWTPYGLNPLRPFDPHGFVLDDRSHAGSPTQWARTAVAAYKEHKADLIVAEKNNGGDMVKSTIHSVDPDIPVKLVHASRGKAKRAEPISAMYEEGRVHHVGQFAKLEDQMTTWDATDPDSSWSPDRMDALVWGLTELMGSGGRVKSQRTHDTRLKGRR